MSVSPLVGRFKIVIIVICKFCIIITIQTHIYLGHGATDVPHQQEVVHRPIFQTHHKGVHGGVSWLITSPFAVSSPILAAVMQ